MYSQDIRANTGPQNLCTCYVLVCTHLTITHSYLSLSGLGGTGGGSFLAAAAGGDGCGLASVGSAAFCALLLPPALAAPAAPLGALVPLPVLRTTGADDRSLACFLRLAERFTVVAPPAGSTAEPPSSGPGGLLTGLDRSEPDRFIVGSEGFRSGFRRTDFVAGPPEDCWRRAADSVDESRVPLPTVRRWRGDGERSSGLRMIVAET